MFFWEFIIPLFSCKSQSLYRVQEFLTSDYEQKSIIITTNKEFSNWSEIFADELLSRAIIDRIMHHSHVLHIKGKSYRIKQQKVGGKMT